MYTTINEQGQLNNYASEPAVYYAEYPSPMQQQKYAVLGAVAAFLVSTLVLVALAVS